ncbi:DNA phosphorothioation-dependent restriction protein DptH [Viridibacillus arvi]|uniref:DNA phosphorothioation-dependent restriction protein DptH n=1 Tax=Viridibacillus arvi TaxID=263475 RepID=UPI0034CD98C0
MLNQFCNYIVEELVEYWNQLPLRSGERFYLQMDSPEEVNAIVEVFRNLNKIEPFVYQHDLGLPFETICLPIDNVKLVIAATSACVTPDYLALIRNNVSLQKGLWKDTALISIVSEELDTIPGGSSDLQKEGMPLHPTSIYKKLKATIRSGKLPKVDQIILEDNLDNLMSDHEFIQMTFLDFADIYTTSKKDAISDDEYATFGLFKDADLATFHGKLLKTRLGDNHEIFDVIKKVHDFGLSEDALHNHFTPEDAKSLMKEDWYEKEFAEINRSHKKYLDLIKKSSVTVESIKVNDDLMLWVRDQGENSTGKRKKHIIIFNPEKHDEITLQVQFSLSGKVKSLSDTFVSVAKKTENIVDAKVKIKNMTIAIRPTMNNSTFTKVIYKHDGRATLGVELFISIIQAKPFFLENYKARYIVNTSRECLELGYEGNDIEFGNAFSKSIVEINESNRHIILSEDTKTVVRAEADIFDDDERLSLNLLIDEAQVLVVVQSKIHDSHPISGLRIWKLIRESKSDINWNRENDRLILGNKDFYFHSEYRELFKWEDYWIENSIRYGKFESGVLRADSIEIDEELREAYSRLLTYFSSRKSIPSLSYLTEEYHERALHYINAYKKAVESFKVDRPAGKRGIDLFKLGTIQSNDEIFFTPFHPIMVAFKLKVYELLKNEEVDNHILSRISVEALVPFLYDENTQLFKPDHQQSAMEWLVFKPVTKVSVADANHYLANVVMDKISQFKEHFTYLFMECSNAPISINVININNDYQVVRGILKWMLKEIERVGIEQLKPIEVALYTDDEDSSFDIYSRINSVENFEELFDIKLKLKDYEASDLLRIFHENLLFYKKPLELNSNNLRYAHITFYKMQAQENHAVQKMEEMVSGIAIDGIYSSVPSMRDLGTYKSGFGTKNYAIDDNNILTTTAYLVNELAANTKNGGFDSYHRGQAILSRTTNTDENQLKAIFESSHWVTFVDPTVDLDFFQNYNSDLVVIHYSDQYTSSSRYDAITVTNKSNQYYSVIKEFLQEKDIDGSNENVINTIKAFNTFNGEWLLRIIGSKGHYDREKLSIISAIKYALSYFDHKNFLWVPISLEEILRVAGVFNLTKTDGIFTAKNLGVKGSHSDDLLLIGLEETEDDLSLHFYPVEVKIGHNQSDVLDKAKLQVKKTAELFENTLTGNSIEPFKQLFYKNFFVQLFIANAKKMDQSQIWKEKGYTLKPEIIEKLLKNNYSIANTLVQSIGIGSVLSFQKEATHRSAYMEDEVQYVNLTMDDGYRGISQPLDYMHDWIQNKSNDLIKEKMLSRIYEPGNNIKRVDLINNISKTEDVLKLEPEYQIDNDEKLNNIKLISPVSDLKKSSDLNNTLKEVVASVVAEKKTPFNVDGDKTNLEKPNDLEGIRLKIGTAENSTKEIFWEYGHKELANRHLLISGKSGQGKTYFMQCLLLEKAKRNISSIVIDYTEGFLPNQLEDEFVSALGDNLVQQIVYNDKLPINPFTKNVREIGGIKLPESNTDVAERIKSVFGAVYGSLGIQQLNSIYEAVIKGLERYETKMNLNYLKLLLEEDGSNTAKTALSQIRPLIDRNPFNEGDSVNWKKIMDGDGVVFVIQLTGFPRDVQLVITEFILWDLWNFSVVSGNKENPMPVIMDEAQNLDHTEKSPSARILTEGRKFGWSAWYATQFLKSQLDSSELSRLQNASQKIYFAPPDQEISNIAASLASEPNEKKYWESKLNSLKKGQCIVQGQNLTADGHLSPQGATIVNISPLDTRL